MFRFENLDIWKEAIAYAERVYTLTQTFPKDELYALTSQLRRSAVSISANIAEGTASSSPKESVVFLSYSIRSLAENVSELHFAEKQGYVTQEQFDQAYTEAELLIRRITVFKKTFQ